jgi:hypothetical protein
MQYKSHCHQAAEGIRVDEKAGDPGAREVYPVGGQHALNL